MPKEPKLDKSNAKEPEGIIATPADFQELLSANPSLELPLVNIIQKRLLDEKNAEIENLKSLVSAKK